MTTGRNPNIGPKIVKEKNVVSKMIGLYCEKKHNSLKGALCEDCSNLQEYSHHRLDHCRYEEDKPTCRKCETHCYQPEMREKIRSVMRFSGPRLVLRAPIDWVKHQLHGRE
ncbi:MAG: nitrous oxide-stimulated promoter family protein [Candidatus Thorarchaeota archaeon]|nr:nitrous oxide-stimulated promoter family protein [Candidatus Thorarchaeota archaeon]